jgi:hypothetical protein
VEEADSLRIQSRGGGRGSELWFWLPWAGGGVNPLGWPWGIEASRWDFLCSGVSCAEHHERAILLGGGWIIWY